MPLLKGKSGRREIVGPTMCVHCMGTSVAEWLHYGLTRLPLWPPEM
jgi:hypothetical protein